MYLPGNGNAGSGIVRAPGQVHRSTTVGSATPAIWPAHCHAMARSALRQSVHNQSRLGESGNVVRAGD